MIAEKIETEEKKLQELKETIREHNMAILHILRSLERLEKHVGIQLGGDV